MKRWLFVLLAACSSAPKPQRPIDDITACRALAGELAQLHVLALAPSARPQRCWITFESRDVWPRDERD